MSHGEARADEFLAALAFEDAWRSKDLEAVVSFFAEDAELVSSAPFPGNGPYNGKARIRSFLTESLVEEVSMDLTKKQVARNGVAWTIRAATGDEPTNRAEGVVEAQFRDGKIKALRLRAGIRAG
jgi:NTE family protein